MECIDHLLHPLARPARRDQAIRPPTNPFGGGLRHGGAEHAWRLFGTRVETGVFDRDAAVMRDRLSAPERTHYLDTFEEASVPLRLWRPSLPRDVLVERLTAAGRDPEAAREHLGEGRRRLRNDRRVVAVTGRVHHAKRERRRLESGTEPRPREAAVSVFVEPGVKVVGAHDAFEARRLRGADVAEQLAGSVLLVRGVISNQRHRRTDSSTAVSV